MKISATQRMIVLTHLSFTIILGACEKINELPGQANLNLRQKLAECSIPKYQKDIVPILEAKCLDCHATDNPKGNINFELMPDEKTAIQESWIWAKVLKQISAGTMPPKNHAPLGPCESQALIAWSYSALDQCQHFNVISQVTLRRLSRTEYANTLRDLLEASLTVAQSLPPDEIGFGFDNNANILATTPLYLEKVNRISEDLMEASLVSPPTQESQVLRVNAIEMERTVWGPDLPNGWVVLNSEGSLFTQFYVTAQAEYTLRAYVFGQQAGPEAVRMNFELNQHSLANFSITAIQNAPQIVEFRATLPKGTAKLGIRFTNDFYNPNDPDPTQRDRNLAVQYLEIIGPQKFVIDPPPDIHKKIMICEPNSSDPDVCAKKILGTWAKKIWRRLPTPNEIIRLNALVRKSVDVGDSFEQGLKNAFQAMLLSPHFLFRPEPQNTDLFNIATRMAFFIWSSSPDDRLIELAESGSLLKPEILKSEIQRMLLDPKAKSLSQNFGAQWLGFRNMDFHQVDPLSFPNFNESLRESMKLETEIFLESVIREREPLSTLINARYTFLNESLANHYNFSKQSGPEFQRVELNGQEAHRGGLLGQGSFFTLTSNPDRSSPTKRGHWILDKLLCQPPAPPPPDVPALPGGNDQNLPIRKRLEIHRQNAHCASCHVQMDPIGLAFEHYDATGAWRDTERDFPIDSSGELPNGMTFKDASDLKNIIQSSAALTSCFSEKLLTFALGRGIQRADQCNLHHINKLAQSRGGDVASFVEEIVLSPTFNNPMRSP